MCNRAWPRRFGEKQEETREHWLIAGHTPILRAPNVDCQLRGHESGHSETRRPNGLRHDMLLYGLGSHTMPFPIVIVEERGIPVTRPDHATDTT